MSPLLKRAAAMLAAGMTCLGTPVSSWAVSLSDIDDINARAACAANCERGALPVVECLDGCPALRPGWDRDGNGTVDRTDAVLAQLESYDEGTGGWVCTKDGRVKPAWVCDSPLQCAAAHGAAECVDADGDGIPRWAESLLGSSDSTPEVPCSQDLACGGFRAECRYEFLADASICRDRTCGADCTAFHLEQASADDQTVIIQVFYDYAPVPATVLDLKISYPRTVLTLLDARPLPKLVANNKQLSVTHLSNGILRLVVFDPGSTTAIPLGAIVELIFQRSGDGQATVAFVTDDFSQQYAVAPEQGTVTEQLREDALWGAPVVVTSSGNRRLVLSYSFDDPTRPLSYARVPDRDALCNILASCANETDATRQAHVKEMLESLQRGVVQASQSIDAVSGGGVYLDGASDHVRMPLALNAPAQGAPYSADQQSFSLSAWFYPEGNWRNEAQGEPQVLFSHNNASERTRMGLMLDQVGSDAVNLKWFDGHFDAATGTTRTTLATLPLRVWTHLGLTVDATTGEVTVYLDGRLTSVLAAQGPVACPRFEGSPGNGILLHQEGDLQVGGRSPEAIYLAAERNGLFGIERMDATGMNRRDVIRSGEHTFLDPDYSPLVDKLVYISNASGGHEVWVADGDGSAASRRVVTSGFGDAARGIFARRPRWAPDGSAIVFESNVYDVSARDNSYARGYHLYHVAYDPVGNEVAIPLESGGTTGLLDYRAQLGAGALDRYRLTKADRNHTGVQWLRGKSGDDQGDILFTSYDPRGEGRRVERMTIPANIRMASQEVVSGLGTGSDEVSMLAAFRKVTASADGPVETSAMLLKRGRVSYGVTDQFTLDATDLTVQVTHAPTGYEAKCWDLNRNNATDADEDRSEDGAWDVEDCYPSAVNDLYLRYDATVVAPDIESCAAGTQMEGLGKLVTFMDVSTSDGSYVRVVVRSPLSAQPLPADAVMGHVVFTRRAEGDPAFTLVRRVAQESFLVKDLTTGAAPEPFPLAGLLETVTAATFSPDGTEMLLTGISDARPVLLKTRDLYTASGASRLSPLPARVEGLSWTRETRFYPCNWVGAYQDPYTKELTAGFRGGLDEVNVWNYVREHAAFRSDADRSFEWLAKLGTDGVLPSLMPACSGSDLECPPYHLCVDRQCTMVACDPADPYSCARGACTLRPSTVEQGNPGFDWVCATECGFDSECFRQACLNGPCRFCDPQRSACMECRPRLEEYGSFTVSTMEGCPDSNSFACVEGTCVSECYATANGVTAYLCDPSVEFCRNGRCQMLEWSWADFAPATFSGLGEPRYDLANLRYTTAISQLYSVTVEAYGVEDYAHAPELLVEGRVTTAGAQVLDGNWFRLGRLLVSNKTPSQATGHPMVLHTPYAVTDLRLRLITPPTEDLNAASTGLMERDQEFCWQAAEAWAAFNGTMVDYGPCVWRASGSRNQLGYPASIPLRDAYISCQERGRADCPVGADPLGGPFLAGGQPTVIITDVRVNGSSVMNNMETNKACSYEGGTSPRVPGTGEVRKVFFGDITREQSPLRDYWCADPAHDCDTPTGLLEMTGVTGKAWALLNCNLANHQDPAVEMAMVRIGGITIIQEFATGAILETANGCTVDLGRDRVAPCYEWMGQDPSLDVLNAPAEPYKTLDFSQFHSFAHDEGFTPCVVGSNPCVPWQPGP
jgi:hypothetical protein